MKHSLLLISIFATAALCGCSTVGKSFDNNVYCKVGEPAGVTVSQWGPFGISANLANGDKLCPVNKPETSAAVATK